MTSLSTPSERIASFVAGFFEPGRLGPPPERIVIRHLSVNDRQSDVGALPLPAETNTEASVIELAGRLGDLITTDADGLGGIQRYVLVALRGTEVLGRLPIRTTGGSDDASGDPIDSEPATARGLVAQLMRHNEANSRIVSLSMGQIVATLLRQNERLRLVAEEAEDKRYAVANLTEQLLSQQHERDLEAKLVEERGELLRHGLTQFRAVLPFVAACFRSSKSEFLRNLSQAFPVPGAGEGGDTGGEAASEDTASLPAGTSAAQRALESGASSLHGDDIGSLLGSLSPEQQNSILQILTPEQQMALFRLAGGASQAPPVTAPPVPTTAAQDPAAATDGPAPRPGRRSTRPRTAVTAAKEGPPR
jgi:hypothetical protein